MCDVYAPVVVEQLIGEVVEQVWLVGRERSTVDLVNGLLQLRNRLIIIPRYIPIRKTALHEGQCALFRIE